MSGFNRSITLKIYCLLCLAESKLMRAIKSKQIEESHGPQPQDHMLRDISNQPKDAKIILGVSEVSRGLVRALFHNKMLRKCQGVIG